MKYLLTALAAGVSLIHQPIRADDPDLPSAPFPVTHYEALWTKSPFAVATPEEAPESMDYSLVGIANVEGVSYASIVETKPPQMHFLISTDKPQEGLTLTSITRSPDGANTYAVVQKDGQRITLKLEQPPAAAGTPGAVQPSALSGIPGILPQQMTMPGANLPSPGGFTRPPTRFRRPLVHLPPAQPQQPPPP